VIERSVQILTNEKSQKQQEERGKKNAKLIAKKCFIGGE